MRHSTERLVFDGVVAGVFGAIVIVSWFAVVDAARGQLLNTSALLPSGLAFQFCALAIIGAAAALILEQGERESALFPALLVFVIAFEIFSITVTMLLGPVASMALPWWKLFIGDLIATAAMMVYFLGRQPVLAHGLSDSWLGAAGEAAVTRLIGAVTEVTCPATNRLAVVVMRAGRVQSCSNWPGRYNCNRGCIAHLIPMASHGNPPTLRA